MAEDNTALKVALWIGALGLGALGIWRLTKNPYIWEGGLLTSGRRTNPTDSAGNYYRSNRWTHRSFVRGEWWIVDGQSVFADQDIGDQGHESLAIDGMFGDLVDAQRQILQAKLDEMDPDSDEAIDVQEEIDALDEYESNESYGASTAYFNADISHEAMLEALSDPPDGADREEVLRDIGKEPRFAYIKHWGAIMAHGSDFSAWVIGESEIRAIQDFLAEEAEEEAMTDPDAEITIEQLSDHRDVSIPLPEFMAIKYPKQLWSAG